MAKKRQFEKILDILVAADGVAVSRENLLKELEGEIEAYRLSSYFWDIKHYANIDVERIKNGRKVVGYRLPAAAPAAPEGSAPDVPAPNVPEGATPVASEADAVAVNRAYYDASLVDDDE